MLMFSNMVLFLPSSLHRRVTVCRDAPLLYTSSCFTIAGQTLQHMARGHVTPRAQPCYTGRDQAPRGTEAFERIGAGGDPPLAVAGESVWEMPAQRSVERHDCEESGGAVPFSRDYLAQACRIS